MREALSKIPKNRYTVFTAVAIKIHYNRLLLKNVKVYDQGGNNVIGYFDHVHVAIKPFRAADVNAGDKVRFTAKPHTYTRSDSTCDYGLIVKRVTKI